jgi:hypothetical protein
MSGELAKSDCAISKNLIRLFLESAPGILAYMVRVRFLNHWVERSSPAEKSETPRMPPKVRGKAVIIIERRMSRGLGRWHDKARPDTRPIHRLQSYPRRTFEVPNPSPHQMNMDIYPLNPLSRNGSSQRSVFTG